MFDKKSERTILIIDDNEDHYLILSRLLKKTYDTDFHTGEADVIEHIKQNIPDCILLDYNLRATTGIDILKQLKSQKEYTEIPVIMLTGEKTPDVIVDCMKHGADDYLIKDDVDKERLLTSLNIIFEKTDLKKHIKTLERFLPICANCKKIRKTDSNPEEQNSWVPIEHYISSHTSSEFSHGICPECMHTLYGDIMDKGK